MGRRKSVLQMRQFSSSVGCQQRVSKRPKTHAFALQFVFFSALCIRSLFQCATCQECRTPQPTHCHAIIQGCSLLSTSGVTSPISGTRRAPTAGVQQGAPLDLAELDQAFQGYLAMCIVSSTRAAYRSAVRRYMNFCIRLSFINPFPLTEGYGGSFQWAGI